MAANSSKLTCNEIFMWPVMLIWNTTPNTNLDARLNDMEQTARNLFPCFLSAGVWQWTKQRFWLNLRMSIIGGGGKESDKETRLTGFQQNIGVSRVHSSKHQHGWSTNNQCLTEYAFRSYRHWRPISRPTQVRRRVLYHAVYSVISLKRFSPSCR